MQNQIENIREVNNTPATTDGASLSVQAQRLMGDYQAAANSRLSGYVLPELQIEGDNNQSPENRIDSQTPPDKVRIEDGGPKDPDGKDRKKFPGDSERNEDFNNDHDEEADEDEELDDHTDHNEDEGERLDSASAPDQSEQGRKPQENFYFKPNIDGATNNIASVSGQGGRD